MRKPLARVWLWVVRAVKGGKWVSAPNKFLICSLVCQRRSRRAERSAALGPPRGHAIPPCAPSPGDRSKCFCGHQHSSGSNLIFDRVDSFSFDSMRQKQLEGRWEVLEDHRVWLRHFLQGSHLLLQQAVTEAGQQELLKTLKVEGKISRVSVKTLGRDGLNLFKLGGSRGVCESGEVYFHPCRIDRSTHTQFILLYKDFIFFLKKR